MKNNLKVLPNSYYFEKSDDNQFFNLEKNTYELVLDKNKQLNIYLFLNDADKLVINLKENSTLKLLLFIENDNDKLEIISNQDNYSNFELKIISTVNNLNSKFSLNLNGYQSNLLLNSLILTNNNDKVNFDFNTINNSKNSIAISNVFAVSSKNSYSRINFCGKINKGMQGSTCEEHLKGLNRDSAKIEINPILVIDEFDVTAGHGASCGTIDNDILFYLMSRGLSKNDAENLYIQGFINPFIEQIKKEELKKYIVEKVSNKI